jgi:uracil phosphoribosyltransferase
MRRSAAALGALAVADALAGADVAEAEVLTPVAPAVVARLRRPVTLVPVLRAGLALLEPALALAPDGARVGFLGMARDEVTLAPRVYMESVPGDLSGDEVVVLEVMIATGGSSVAALDAVVRRGAERPRLVGLIAAPEGLARVAAAHPDAGVTVCAVDERLDDRGFIVPGLGDAGDRLYGACA